VINGDLAAIIWTLNTWTISDRYLVRYIEDFSQILEGKTIFSTLNFINLPSYSSCRRGYPEDNHYYALRYVRASEYVLWSAQTFQRFIDGVLEG